MTDEALLSPADLTVVRNRRAGLRRACRELARHAAAGVTGPADRVALTRSLDVVAERWDRHVAETEAPGGLLEQVLTDAPRLATTVARLRREHRAICDLIAEARAQLVAPDATPDAVASRLQALLGAVERHSRAGGELLHGAYNVDIGLGE